MTSQEFLIVVNHDNTFNMLNRQNNVVSLGAIPLTQSFPVGDKLVPLFWIKAELDLSTTNSPKVDTIFSSALPGTSCHDEKGLW